MTLLDVSWFWYQESNFLFLGYSGNTYPGAHEVEPCREMTRAAADDVVMRQLMPYRESIVTPDMGITLSFARVIAPPTL